MQGEKTKIGIIEWIRGMAAISVCLFHFSKTNMTFPGSASWFQYFARHGWTGVEAFFVVSGFVIPYSLESANYKTRLFPRFMVKRWLRIEPSYLISMILVVLLGYFSTWFSGFQGPEFHVSPLNLFLHVFYLPAHFGFEWLQPVYWSLESEIHFYIIMGLCYTLIFQSRISLIFSILAGCVLSSFIPLTVFGYMPYFAMGMLVFGYKSAKINIVLLLSGLILLFFFLVAKTGLILPSTVGLISSLLISFVKFRSRLSDFMGRISYSLYLVHIPVAGRLLNYSGRYADSSGEVWITLIIVFLITILAAWLFYLVVDRPFRLLSRRIAGNF